MIKVHFYRSETAADSFIKDHPLYNRVKRGWQLNSQGKRVYGYWVGYESKPKKVNDNEAQDHQTGQ